MRDIALASLFFVVGCTIGGCAVFDAVVPASEPQPQPPSPTNGATDGAAPSGASSPDAPADDVASAPSCARKHGGATCGPDGKDDCCAVATQPTAAGTAKLNKYLITAGRMRAFVDSVNGDVAGFVKKLPADKWKPEWTTSAVPTDRASADVALGPAGKKACQQGANTGHTFWTPATGADVSDYDQDTLDDKALNCVPWQLAQALCAFDGGRLATVEELRAAFTNGGTTQFPWGDDGIDPSAQDPEQRLNNEFTFATAPNPATFRGTDHPSEISFFIAPPGRFPNGNNRAGIADVAGNLLEWVSDSPRQFVWKGDFERHAADAATFNGGSIWMDKTTLLTGTVPASPWIWGSGQLFGNAGSADQKDGYYSIGGRCAF